MIAGGDVAVCGFELDEKAVGGCEIKSSDVCTIGRTHDRGVSRELEIP